jgi:amino acid adenylation domain-containing protein
MVGALPVPSTVPTSLTSSADRLDWIRLKEALATGSMGIAMHQRPDLPPMTPAEPAAQWLQVLEQLAAKDLARALQMLARNAAAWTLARYATNDTGTRWAAALASGSASVAVAMTEAGAGSNPRAMTTTARRLPDGRIRIDGRKQWSGFAARADLIIVYADFVENDGSHPGIAALLVSRDSLGVSVGPDLPMLGPAGYPLNDVDLDGVVVGTDAVLARPGRGLEIASSSMGRVRIGVAAIGLGIMKRCALGMHDQACSRRVATGALIDNPLTRSRLGELSWRIASLDALLAVVGSGLDEGVSIPASVAMICKNQGAEGAGWAADQWVQLLGARGYDERWDAAALWRDARCLRILEGPTETLHLQIGADLGSGDAGLLDFLSGSLVAPDLGRRVRDAVQSAPRSDSVPSGDEDPRSSEAFLWTAVQLGHVATEAVLCAAIQYAARTVEGADARRRCDGARARLDRVVSDAIAALKMRPPQRDELATWASGLAESLARDDDAEFEPAHLQFQAIARQMPDGIALERAGMGTGTAFTYQELDIASDRLALRLMAAKVGSEVLVAILCDDDAASAAAILAVLKAGGAFVPLDPDLPLERLAYILEDAHPAVLLKRRAGRIALTPPKNCRVMEIDEPESAHPVDKAPAMSRVDVAPSHLAYVVYTSGSTGQPKGVLVEHRGLALVVPQVARELGLGPGCRLARVAAAGFDAALGEVFFALTTGATLVSAERGRGAIALPRFLDEARITHLLCTPTMLAQEPPGALPGLRVVMSVGEACPVQVAERWGMSRRFLNGYGPTEATIHATSCEYLPGSGVLPIGRPLSGVRAYVVGREGHLVRDGVAGELWIGGVGVARGYLGQAALTASRFVPDPFDAPPGARLFRTGDDARRLPDGRLQFLGRRDRQVKVRGFRVECAEIDDALLRHPDVARAIVLPRPGRDGACRLAAFYQARADTVLTRADVARYLAPRLPAYMQPDEVTRVERWPRTLNGKLDLHALLEFTQAVAATSPVAPPADALNANELRLAALWSELLERDIARRDDDFFEQGGNSLSIALLASRIREAFEVELSLSDLFDAPTLAGQATLLERGHAPVAGTRSVLRRQGATRSPPSFGQERLWLVDQIDPHATAYHVPLAMHLEGPLDEFALATAFEQLVQRHESLRTRFEFTDGALSQVIDARLDAWQRVVLARRDAGDALDEVRGLIAARLDEPFDLETGPLVRAVLYELDPVRHVLLIVMHHIVADAWSVGILIRELGELYAAALARRPARLPPLHIQYPDYARWQRDGADELALAPLVDHWMRYLDGVGDLYLQVGSPPSSEEGQRGATHWFECPEELAAALRDFNRQHDVTMFMTLMAAWQVLLVRYGGGPDFAIGFPVAGRGRREFEDLIGFFTNTLVLRARVDGDGSFLRLLQRVRIESLEAFAHQELPYERLVEAMVARQPGRAHDLFRVMFVWQNAPVGTLHLPGIEVERLRLSSADAEFDLTLFLREYGSALRGYINYRTGRFESDTIVRMAVHFVQLLRSLIAHPDVPVSRAAMLTDDERRICLIDWNATRRSWPDPRCVHELFEARVEETPGAPALIHATGSMDYACLDRHADDLAGRLRDMGVGPGGRVGFFLPRSPSMVVAMLGILKSGAAYVPLEVSAMPERLARIVGDARLDAIVALDTLADALPVATPLIGLSLDDGPPGLERRRMRSPGARGASMRDAAYVLYTSGTTGTTKGVVMEHAAAANLVRWQVSTLHDPTPGRTLQFAEPTFDVSFQEVFSTLCAGGTLVLASNAAKHDPVQLLAEIRRGEVTRAFLPNVVLEQLAEVASGEGLPGCLREVLVAGEALRITAPLARACAARSVIVTNQFGPTECHVVSSETLEGPASRWPTSPPIGRPIANCALYVLDRFLEPVAVGVVGELYIAGQPLARGYLNRAALTASRFLPNPFGDPGSRMYRTGDLVRNVADGRIAFVGRIDDEVKIRGHRFSLGEVEATITAHPAVAACAVTADVDSSGHRQLEAYVVPVPEQDMTVQSLRTSLLPAMPKHMIPVAFVFLPHLPITRHGKVDRQALRALQRRRPALDTPDVPARNRTENALVDIWSRVLDVDHVGVLDDFFMLGGQSMRAVQVVVAISRKLGRRVPVRLLLDNPTIAEFAAALDDLSARSPRTTRFEG